MAGRMDISELKKLRDKLKRNCSAEQIDRFCESCAKRIAGQLLRDVVKRTPVKSGKLASSWTAGAVEKDGDTYTITVKNNALSDSGVPYAIYVEYGHRTKKGGWVEGRKMLTITEEEIKDALPNFIDRKIKEFLRRCMQ